jgi:hypothetical protein
VSRLSHSLGWGTAAQRPAFGLPRHCELQIGLAEAVDAHEVSVDPAQARQVLDLAPLVPALTWGRDELHAGEMWNSNSLTAWLLARSGHQMADIHPPVHGRAPGWHAGEHLAATSSVPTDPHSVSSLQGRPPNCSR